MHPDRLQVQVAVMDSEPSIGLCNCWAKPFGDGIRPSKNWDTPSFYGLIRHPLVKFIRGNYIIHPAVMLRKSVLEKYNFQYNPNYPYAEDYKLWTEMAKAGVSFFMISQSLMYYRVSKDQVSTRYKKEQRDSAQKIQLEVIRELISRNKCKDSLEKTLEGMLKTEKITDLIGPSLIQPYFFDFFSRLYK